MQMLKIIIINHLQLSPHVWKHVCTWKLLLETTQAVSQPSRKSLRRRRITVKHQCLCQQEDRLWFSPEGLIRGSDPHVKQLKPRLFPSPSRTGAARKQSDNANQTTLNTVWDPFVGFTHGGWCSVFSSDVRSVEVFVSSLVASAVTRIKKYSRPQL